MRIVTAVFLSVSSALAYQNTYRGRSQGWTISGHDLVGLLFR